MLRLEELFIKLLLLLVRGLFRLGQIVHFLVQERFSENKFNRSAKSPAIIYSCNCDLIYV